MIRSHRLVLSQSSAIAMADGVEAHALFTETFGPLAPIDCANCECPIVNTCNKNRRSKFPSLSAPFFWACSIACSTPGKHDAKMTPVRSRSDSGKCQLCTKRFPALLICSTATNGRPASFSASSPAAIASEVVISMASTIFGSIPYCCAKSKCPFFPANCGIKLKSLQGTNSAEPSACLMIRTKSRSNNRCLISSDTSAMKLSPRVIRSNVSGANTSSIPGRPRLIPENTNASICLESALFPVTVSNLPEGVLVGLMLGTSSNHSTNAGRVFASVVPLTRYWD